MVRYSTSRHRKLMDASEHALADVARSSDDSIKARTAKAILDDDRRYRLWEQRHAELMLPMSAQRSKKSQVMALRQANVDLVHNQAFFNYLQSETVRGERRRQLFRLFHATRYFEDAVIAEHQQYMLSVSSEIGTEHIGDIMVDDRCDALLIRYRRAYARYFKMQCYLATVTDSSCIDLVRSAMHEHQRELHASQRRLRTEGVSEAGGTFDDREPLARSGRYRALNYLNRY